jgi:hypothetical protein
MRRALAIVVLLLAAAGCGSSAPERASGVTERWLQAISDSGRSRVRDDATERAAEDGDPVRAGALLPDASEHDDDDEWFSDLEVGKAIEHGDTARVPLRLTREDDDKEIFATAMLMRDGRGWRIVGIEASRPGELVPSKGGDRPATATARHWLAAVAVGALVTVVSALVIELQPVPERAGQVAAPAD